MKIRLVLEKRVALAIRKSKTPGVMPVSALLGRGPVPPDWVVIVPDKRGGLRISPGNPRTPNEFATVDDRKRWKDSGIGRTGIPGNDPEDDYELQAETTDPLDDGERWTGEETT